MKRNLVLTQRNLHGRITQFNCECGYVFWVPSKERKKGITCASCLGVPRNRKGRISGEAAFNEVISAIYPNARYHFLKRKARHQRILLR